MPEKRTIDQAREDAAEGKSPSTQAGEFVREEIDHIREGKHGARSAKQAIAIGLSKARRAGVSLPSPKGAPERTKAQARRDSEKGQSGGNQTPSRKRSQASSAALRREGKSAASHRALSAQAKSSAKKRRAAGRHEAAVKAAHTQARRKG